MGVDAVHESYRGASEQWQRCRDAVAGSDAIKRAGTKYLPQLTAQSRDEYTAYQMRALWYGATARTLQGLTGAVMRKEPAVTIPDKLTAVLQDVTRTGVAFSAFAKGVVSAVLEVGRMGVLVDLPKDGDTVLPYWAAYQAEAIINWRSAVVAGRPVLVFLVLKECVQQPKPDDPFTMESVEQYRVLQLNAEGHYHVEVYRQGKGKWTVEETIVPTLRGQPLTYIPFCFFGPNTLTAEIEKPPILDLVDVNLSHYRSSADLEHGRHYCGLPTPWVAGFPATTELKIGSAVAWVATDPQAKAGMLEFTGQGLTALENACAQKEKLMAVLGARLLEEAKKTVEASDTLSTRLSGEQSVLRSVANTISTGLSKLLEWAGLWSGMSPDEAKTATVKLNTDFMDTQMTFAELESLVRTWQTGAISYETLYYNMERGEVTRPGIDADTEKAQAELETPPDLGNVLPFGSRG